jgi:6,7-dimethyl-8-ribityllumazine synthase
MMTNSLVVPKDLKFAIVTAKFNDFFTNNLTKGCESTLIAHGADAQNISKYYVPGCFEIPLVLKKLAQTRKFDALIALGAVIRGSTPHFDFVCSETSSGISRVSYDFDIPIGFGIITTDNLEQTLERSGSKAGNKGSEAALAIIEQLNLLISIDRE